MDQQDDALFEYLEQESKIKNQCYRDGDVIVLNVDYEYTISIEDCKTESELLWWVVHLSKKKWMELDLLGRSLRLSVT